jgi:hypothetical protein
MRNRKRNDNKNEVFQEKFSACVIKKAIESKNKTDKEFRTTYYKYKDIKYSMHITPLTLKLDL